MPAARGTATLRRMWPVETLAIVGATFLLAGMVKGVVGLGLPTVALAVLAVTLGHREAMALMLIPSLVTNLWQMLDGGHLRALLRRLWPLLLAVCAGVWLGASLLARADPALASTVFGLMLIAYGTLGLTRPHTPAPGPRERWLSPLIGAVNGVVTGLTGSFVVPGVLYLESLALPRDALIQAMGLLFSVSTLMLGGALAGQALLPGELGLLSVLAMLPTVAGMWAGRALRRRLSEARFRRVFFVALLALGLYLVLRPLL